MDDNDCTYEACTSAHGAQPAVVIQSERRRRWSDEAKLRIVQETLVPGTITSLVARRHGIGTGQLYTWRKQMMVPLFSGHGFRPFVVRPVPGSCIRERNGSAGDCSSPRYTRTGRVAPPRGLPIDAGGQARP